MIDTNAIRAKTVDAAVTGELTADYKSQNTVDIDFNKMGIVPGEVLDDEIPYELKEGWKWVRVVDLGADTKNSFADGPFGSNLKREHYTTDKQVRIIQLSNVGELGWKDDNEKYTTFDHLETIKRSEVVAGNIVIAKMMPAGRAIIVPEGAHKYVLSSDCVKFVPNAGLNTRYLCYSINSQMFRKQVLQDVHGIGRERTSLSKLKSYLLPIPPVDEQQIIVERIDAIYDLLNKIDELQHKYESDFSVLKGKIIDAGIRGKLTEQLPEDGDAETLYLQIQEEKAKLIKEGKIKKEKPLPEIDADEIPFEIPKNWKWVRFGNLMWNRDSERIPVSVADRKKLAKTYDYYGASGVIDKVEEYLFDEKLLLIGEDGANLLSRSTPIAFLADGKYWVNNHAHVLGYYKYDYLDFVMYYINSISLVPYVTGAAQPKLNQENMNKIPVPLPPYLEQKRIVAKISEILQIIA